MSTGPHERSVRLQVYSRMSPLGPVGVLSGCFRSSSHRSPRGTLEPEWVEVTRYLLKGPDHKTEHKI